MADETQSQSPFGQELKGFLSGIALGKENLAQVRKLLLISAGSLALLIIISAASFSINIIPAPILPYALYCALSSVGLMAAIAHYHSHRMQFTCMEGMMVGMTIGMMGGFLFGAIIGATNGMFIGSLCGMAIGMASGAWCGKCCGIMGALEGLMAGLMGGTMGAMLTVMMALDNLSLFMPIFVSSCLLILAGLSFMIYSCAGKREEARLMKWWKFAIACALLFAATLAVMLLAPRSSSVIL
jgi:hypothetical protein